MSTHSCSNCGYENEPSAKFCGNCGRDLTQPSIGTNLVGTTLLGRYTIRRVIAVGGMGVVYEADQSLGDYHRTVAIKTLRPELSLDPTIVSRFNRECGIVAQLTHQNTVSLYDYGTTDDGTLYIAMEFVRGQSLAEALAGGALPVDRTQHIIDQMCHSLEEAHNLGIVHRDLKPDNVVLTDHGAERDCVKVLDFGIAVRLSVGTNHETKLTQQGMILGTPPYMSPEQFTGARVTRCSDIYSLGIIAYEALTGRLPFEADTPWMWAQRHLTSAPPDLPSTFPEHVVSAVRLALSKDPSNRPQSAVEFSQMLAGARATSRGFDEQARFDAVDHARTEPDAPPAGTRGTPVTSPDMPLVKTDPAAPPMMAAQAPVYAPGGSGFGSSPYANAPYVGVPMGNGRTRRSRKGLWIGLITEAALALCGVGFGVAVSMDLVENPFADDAAPTALPTAASATVVPPNVSQPQNVVIAPNANDLPAPNLPAEPSPRAHSRAGASSATTHTEPAPSASGSAAPSTSASAPGGFGLPPFTFPTSLPGLPSSLPSLPSSLPPLAIPTSFAGIPIPPIFPGQQPTPSAAPSPTPPSPGN